VEMFYFTKPALEDSIFNRRRRVGIPSTKSILQNVCLCQFRIFIYICHDLFCVQWFDWAVLVCFVYNDLIGQYLFVLCIMIWLGSTCLFCQYQWNRWQNDHQCLIFVFWIS
jgi:hypothetical protein